jgi:hypothetical protein
LTNSTSVKNGQIWDNPGYNFTFPFGFSFYNKQKFTAKITETGMEFLNLTEIDVFGAQLKDRGTNSSLSPISYVVVGAIGQRIAKIEWKNAGFNNGAASDFINFQLWLYEFDNKIEMRYGPGQVANNSAAFNGRSGIFLDVYQEETSPFEVITLFGDPQNPSVDRSFAFVYMQGFPADGTVYSFTYDESIAAVEEKGPEKLMIYSNPADQKVIIKGAQNAKVEILNLKGQVVTPTIQIKSMNQEIPVDLLPNGWYMVRIQTDKDFVTKKLLVKH